MSVPSAVRRLSGARRGRKIDGEDRTMRGRTIERGSSGNGRARRIVATMMIMAMMMTIYIGTPRTDRSLA
jgi:hypothetical protein